MKKKFWEKLNKKTVYIVIGICACIAIGIGVWYNSQSTPKQMEPIQEVEKEDTKYKELKEKNPDFYGWLKIDNTSIDYPVMYKDNEYYLNHTFDLEEDIYGTPFIDEKCNIEERSDNLLIHGHSTLSGPEGKMFDDLFNYKEKAYYEENKIIHFDTPEEKADYEIIMVIESRIMYKNETNYRYYNFIDAADEADFEYQMEELKKLTIYDTGVDAQYGDELITLSTCDTTRENGRLAIIAKKIS